MSQSAYDESTLPGLAEPRAVRPLPLGALHVAKENVRVRHQHLVDKGGACGRGCRVIASPINLLWGRHSWVNGAASSSGGEGAAGCVVWARRLEEETGRLRRVSASIARSKNWQSGKGFRTEGDCQPEPAAASRTMLRRATSGGGVPAEGVWAQYQSPTLQ